MANDVFEKFKSSFNRGITTISVKTSSTIEKTKIKTHIDSLKKEIERTYFIIGENAFKNWAAGSSDFSSLNDMFAFIQTKLAEIDALNAELSSIDERDNQILGNTSAEQSSQPSGYVCSSCGERYDTPVNFCRKCGNKIS